MYGLILCCHGYSIHELTVPASGLPVTKANWNELAKSFWLLDWSVPLPWLVLFDRHYAIQRSSHLMSTPTITCAQVLICKDDWVTKWRSWCHWRKNVLLTFPEKRGHAMPCRATRKASGFGQKAKAGVRRKPGTEPLLRFPWERQTREELGIGWFEWFCQALGHRGFSSLAVWFLVLGWLRTEEILTWCVS